MKRAVHVLAIAGLLLTGCSSGPRGADGAGALASRIDPVVEAERARLSIPGLSVVVTRGGRILHAKGYGTANRETGTPATPQTVYQIGSISKQFTAAAILLLVEDGKLSVDDRITDRLPGLPDGWREVRLHHLLQQVSGIPDFLFLPEFAEGGSDVDRPAAELRAIIARQPLQFSPGERWSYSNSNYTLLAALIEHVTGLPYDQFLDREIFQPLGLESLHHCPPSPSGPRDARGYGLREGSILAVPPENMNWARGDGGLCGSAEDLAVWARALATGKVVRSYQRMITADPVRSGMTPDYGFGLSLIELDGKHRKVAHHGAMSGFMGMLAFYPDEDLVVSVLANRGGLVADSIEKAVARTVLFLPAPEIRSLPLAAGEADRYRGEYDMGPFKVRVVARDARLWIESPPPAPTAPLLSQGEGRFVSEADPDAIELVFETRGSQAERLVLSMAGMHWYGVRAR